MGRIPTDSRIRPARTRLRPTGARDAAQIRRLRRLGTEPATPEVEGLFIAKLRLRIPTTVWTGQFSRAHPNIRLEVLNHTDVTPDVSVSDYWIDGAAPGQWARELLQHDEVLKVDSPAEVGGGCLYRITYQNPPVIYVYRRLSLPLQFPLHIQGGRIDWEIVARRTEFDQVMQHARSADPELTIVSIRRRPLRSHLPMLTDPQHALLTQAMAAGYFSVPRGITLTQLARKVNRSKSSVSEAIALIELKLLDSVMRTGMSPAIRGAGLETA